MRTVGDMRIADDEDQVEELDQKEDEASYRSEELPCSSFRDAEDQAEAEAEPYRDPFGAYRFVMSVVSHRETVVGCVFAEQDVRDVLGKVRHRCQ